MVVTYKTSYSDSSDSDEFSWTWNASSSVSKVFHFALKSYFISKTIRCFSHCVFNQWSCIYILDFKCSLHSECCVFYL